MDLGVLLESPKGSQSSSRVGSSRALSSRTVAAVSRFPSRVSRDLWLSVEAFPRGFPTGLSHVRPWCEPILGLKVEAVQGKQLSLKWTAHLGDSGNGGTTLEFLSPFLWRAPLLEMRRERRKFFPEHSGKDPSSRAMRLKRGSVGCGRDSRASFRVETGMSGNFLSCNKGVKGPLEVPEVRCD